MTRKVTDVLLSIEKKVRELLGHINNQNMLLMNLTNRLKSLENKTSATDDVLPQKIMPGIKPGVTFQKNKSTEKNDTPKNQDDYQFESFDPSPSEEPVELQTTLSKGKRRDARYVSTINRNQNIPVQQKILYPDGKNLAMANVEIFAVNENNDPVLIKTLKTNATGKWTATLKSGEYIVRVSKKATAQKPPVQLQTNVTIPNSDEPVQLKPVQAKGK